MSAGISSLWFLSALTQGILGFIQVYKEDLNHEATLGTPEQRVYFLVLFQVVVFKIRFGALFCSNLLDLLWKFSVLQYGQHCPGAKHLSC